MSNLDKIDHVVVLMLENHSLDSLLGYLYEEGAPRSFIGKLGDPPAFDGVFGKELSNPGPPGAAPVPVGKAPWATQLDMCCPYPDPGEELYPHVNTQLFGEASPGDTASPPPMSGFVIDYLAAIREQSLGDRPITVDEYRLIMNCFTPAAMPVLNGLAKSFAVSDRWFCSVPSQTFCNRSFLHSGQSNGFVTNADYVKWLRNTAPTILNHLSDAHFDWRVYFDLVDVFSATRALHPTLHAPRYDGNFRHFSQFRADCEAGLLPAYTFIEPRLLMSHNDMHPPVFLNPLVDSSLLAGELLVNDVYNAVRSNQKAWERTLLVILFDEHGGCYDHVPPPAATPPGLPVDGDPEVPGKAGGPFLFDRFGVRVPAIFVSPWIEEGTVVRAPGDVPFDHTTVIRTLCDKLGVPPLGARDLAAPSLEPLLSRSTPRTDAPTFTPRPYFPTPEPLAQLLPLTHHQDEWVRTFAAALGAPLSGALHNVGQAIAHLTSAMGARLSKL
jgi:phospholipase C